MTYSASQQSAMKQVLSDILSEVRPDEAILVDHSLDSDTSKTGQTSGMLGFGYETEVSLLLPYVLEFLKDFANTTVKDLASKWGKELSEWLCSKSGPAKPRIDLDLKAVKGLGDALKRRLREQGVDSAEAAHAGDCLVSTLIAHPHLAKQLIAV